MLAMLARGEELMAIPIVAIVFSFVYLMVRTQTRERERRLEREKRYALLEKAIQSGVIDEHTKRELLEAVTTDRPMRRMTAATADASKWALPPLLLALGWIGLFVGGGLFALGIDRDEDLVMGGAITALACLGVVSVPHALREMQARKT